MVTPTGVHVIIRARAPLRISFAGGGTDVWPYYQDRTGAVLSTTINRYAYATVTARTDSIISVNSIDYDLTVSFDIEKPVVYDGQLDLAKGVASHFRTEGRLAMGADIDLHNDAPPGSGLGSSSALTVALVQAIAEHVHVPMGPYEVADAAYRIERIEVGIKGGKQDQYACTFGGINFIEFTRDATVVNPLRIKPEVIAELEYSLLFAYIGGVHFSSHIIEKQMDGYAAGRTEAFDGLRDLAYETKKALLLGKLRKFGELLDAGWQFKRRLADEISNPRIDEIYDHARKAGALGGKLSGAGGGGFMFFFCEPRRRFHVQDALKQMGAEIVSFSLTQEGVRSWTVD
jgi:D-glycero-alpha-D-manno-heptose-7-phosphate kinase